MMSPRPIPLLTFAIAIVGANSLLLPPIAAVVAADLDTATSAVVRAMGAYGAGTALSALVLAPRADRIGADRALRQACALLVLALSLSALAPSVTWLVLAHGLAGLGAGMALPAIYGLAAQLAPPGREQQTLSTVLSGWTLSLVGGVVLAATLAELTGWRSIYALLAGLTALTWGLLGRCDMQIKILSKQPTSPLTALRVPGVLAALFSNGMLMLAFFGGYSFLGAHVVDGLGRSTASAGLVTMAYGCGFGLVALRSGWLAPLGLRGTLLLGFAGLCVAYLGMALAAGAFALLLGLALIWGLFQHIALIGVLARLNRLDPRQRGAIMGVNSATTYLSVTVGALSFGLPYGWGGIAACLLVSALCTALACLEAARARFAP